MKTWGVLLSLLVGCSTTPRTQVTAELTADPGVMAEAVKVRIVVRGRALSEDFVERANLTVPVDTSRWPLTHAMIPEGNNPQRQYLIEAVALDSADQPVAEARAISGYIAQQTLRLSMHFFDACRGVECSDTQTCNRDGVCETARRNVETLCQQTDCAKDGGGNVPDAGMDVPDVGADVPPACAPADCDDGVACTVETCSESVCASVPDNSLCVAALDGRCDPDAGCQYPTCSPETCLPGPCQTAMCDGETCVRENACDAAQVCCGDACIAPCTGRECVRSVCDPEVSACVDTVDVGARCSDDGTFCNGSEFCSAAGTCVSAGSPCAAAPCDESDDSCGDCADVGMCPSAPPPTSWGACDATGICQIVGIQSRTVYEAQCNVGSCDVVSRVERQPCTIDTDGTPCGVTIMGPCDSWCMQSNVIYRCAAGSCAAMPLAPMSCGLICTPSMEIECGNSVDDDRDGYVDCQDCDCEGVPHCAGMPCSEV